MISAMNKMVASMATIRPAAEKACDQDVLEAVVNTARTPITIRISNSVANLFNAFFDVSFGLMNLII